MPERREGVGRTIRRTTGYIVAGLVPLLAGTFDACVLSRLFGGPFAGTAIRACKHR